MYFVNNLHHILKRTFFKLTSQQGQTVQCHRKEKFIICVYPISFYKETWNFHWKFLFLKKIASDLRVCHVLDPIKVIWARLGHRPRKPS